MTGSALLSGCSLLQGIPGVHNRTSESARHAVLSEYPDPQCLSALLLTPVPRPPLFITDQNFLRNFSRGVGGSRNLGSPFAQRPVHIIALIHIVTELSGVFPGTCSRATSPCSIPERADIRLPTAAIKNCFFITVDFCRIGSVPKFQNRHENIRRPRQARADRYIQRLQPPSPPQQTLPRTASVKGTVMGRSLFSPSALSCSSENRGRPFPAAVPPEPFLPRRPLFPPF